MVRGVVDICLCKFVSVEGFGLVGFFVLVVGNILVVDFFVVFVVIG